MGKMLFLVTFSDYNIQALGTKWSNLGHAGVLLIDNKTGAVKYYEYGRYETKDGTSGRASEVGLENAKIVMGDNGKPTVESLNKVLAEVSKKSGQNGKIEGAYVESDKNKEMNYFAKSKVAESTFGNKSYDKSREPYDLTDHNCGTFAEDVITQDKDVDKPWVVNPTPINLVDEYQEEGNAPVTYDPKANKTTVGQGGESYAKISGGKKRNANPK